MHRLWRAGVAVCAMLGFLFLAVSFTPLTIWWARVLAGSWNDPQGETVIVLGGAVLEGGVIGQNSYWRAVYARLAYKEGGVRRLVIAGGAPDNPVSETMKNFLVCDGLPADAIATETDSLSTRENAVNVARLLKDDHTRKVLLTSDYHMYRALRAFRKVGLHVAPRPFPDAIKRAGRWDGRWPVFLTLSAETARIVYYYARGWI
jgi:uncharacterized SAM-binding protein YcdF (DUF218 family)